MKVELEQRGQEWLEHRRYYCNASEADVIMRCAPNWKQVRTWYQLDQLKKGLIQVRENPAMARGTALEPRALALASLVLGVDLEPSVHVLDGIPPLSASLDGLSPDGKVKVEVKTVTGPTSEAWKSETILDYHKWQLVHQCIVCPTEKTYLMVYLDDEHYKLLPFSPPEADKQALISGWSEFWSIKDHEPDVLEVEELAGEVEYLAAKQLADEANARLEAARQALIEAASAIGPSVRTPRLSVAVQTRKGNISYNKIPELKNIDLDQYRGKPTHYYTIREI